MRFSCPVWRSKANISIWPLDDIVILVPLSTKKERNQKWKKSKQRRLPGKFSCLGFVLKEQIGVETRRKETGYYKFWLPRESHGQLLCWDWLMKIWIAFYFLFILSLIYVEFPVPKLWILISERLSYGFPI